VSCAEADVAVDYDPEFGMGEEMFKDLALSKESLCEYHSKLDEDSPG
jgi:cullin-4